MRDNPKWHGTYSKVLWRQPTLYEKSRAKSSQTILPKSSKKEEKMKLILFDIDGTLLRSNNSIHVESYSYAIAKVCGIEGHLYDIVPDGKVEVNISGNSPTPRYFSYSRSTTLYRTVFVTVRISRTKHARYPSS